METQPRYYVLQTESPNDEAMIGEYPDLPVELSWFGGRRIAQSIPEPLVFKLLPEAGNRMPAFFMPSIPMMRRDLLAALDEAGVDNLDLYPARIEDPRNEQVWNDYMAVNVIGVVACASAKSQMSRPRGSNLIDVDFDSLVIDEARTGGALLFRLAECVTAIIAHEKVKLCVEAKGIPGVVFVPPEDWVG